MKKWQIIGIAVAALVAVCLLANRACDIQDRYSTLMGEYNIIKADNERLAKEADSIRLDMEKAKAEADKKIAQLSGDLKKKDATIAALRGDIGDLEKLFPQLVTCDEKLVNMTGQRDKWKESFNLADAKCKDYEGIVFSLGEKYNAQVKITDTWKGQYEQEKVLREKGEEVSASLRWSLRKARLVGTIKSGLIVGAAAYLIYNLVKGK